MVPQPQEVCAQDKDHKEEHHKDRMPSDPHGQRTTLVFLVVLLRQTTVLLLLLLLLLLLRIPIQQRGFLGHRLRYHPATCV